MSEDNIVALLKVAEEILFSITLPQKILEKYQNLRNSLLSTSEFSLQKFTNSFTPRPTSSLPSHHQLAELFFSSFTHILERSLSIIKSYSVSHQAAKLSQVLPKSLNDFDATDISSIASSLEFFELKIMESLDILKNLISNANINLRTLEEELINKKTLSRSQDFESLIEEHKDVLYENEQLKCENEQLKLESERLKDHWGNELKNARSQWSAELSRMQAQHKLELHDLSTSHSEQMEKFTKIQKEKLNNSNNSYKENEKRLLDKLTHMNLEQTDVLNTLNERILLLTTANSEDKAYIEEIADRIDGIIKHFDLIEKDCDVSNPKEKALSRLDDLELVLEKNKGNMKKCSKFELNHLVGKLQGDLVQNYFVLKEFEEARSKLLKHFTSTTNKKSSSKTPPMTTRF